MRSLLVAATILAVATSAHQLSRLEQEAERKVQMPPKPPVKAAGSWVDLFSPPYQGVPTVTMAISCIDDTTCFVPGGANNVGFDMFNFDGHTNGVFTPLVMPDAALMMMAVGMGGSKSMPKGVAGGIGIGNGLQYAANATTFLPSKVPTLMVETQDIRTSKSGMESIAIDSAHVLYTADAGMTFSEMKINSDYGKCAFGRYGAMISAQEWFVTMGSWPENNKKQGERELSERVYHTKNGQRKTRKMMNKVQKGGDDNCGYSAVIAKTVDGGKTFTNVFANISNSSDFYFNGIDCSSATNCVAVGEGFNANAAGHIFHSADGKTFTEVKTLVSGSSGMYSLMSVKFMSATEVWVAGSMEGSFTASAVFMVSMDGGKTWTDESGSLSNIGDITDISFTPDGKHGFATAVTTMDDSTVLRYGSTPLPPAPPAPPTSGPTGTFTQMQSTSATCADGQNHTFQTGVCLPLNGGGSAIASCTPDTLVQTLFLGSSSCTGANKTSSSPLDKCLKDNQGTYFENFCEGHGPAPSTSPSAPTTSAAPMPPTPPMTTAAPSDKELVQMHCTDSGCTAGCQNGTFPTGTCVPAQGGGSAMVTCDSTQVTETIYTTSDCTGSSQAGHMAVGQCLQAQGGGYLENLCIKKQGVSRAIKGEVLIRMQETMRFPKQ